MVLLSNRYCWAPFLILALRRLGDGGTASDGELQTRDSSGGGGAKKQPRRRENHARRHTLQNGIDYGLVSLLRAVSVIFVLFVNADST